MQPLTVLEEALAQAHGLAIAAGDSAVLVQERMPAGLRNDLHDLREDERESRARCHEATRRLAPDTGTQMLAHANTIAWRMSDFATTWFRAGTDPLAAWNFLAMTEAGEVAAWRAVAELAARAGPGDAAVLAAWALPVHEGHLALALHGTLQLAEGLDPLADRAG